MAEDRAALLEKIRADMAASRKKIAEMKEKKARGTVLLSTGTTQGNSEDAKKFEETTNLVEKLRAERAAKKEKEGDKVSPAKALSTSKERSSSVASPNDSPNIKRIVVVRKKEDGTEEKIIKDIPLGSPDPKGRIKQLSNAGDTRQRSPSIGERFKPSDRMRKPSIDQGARTRGISIDQGDGRTRTSSIDIGSRRKMPNRTPVSTTPDLSAIGAKGGNIRSLADMKNAIDKAGKVKQDAERQGKLEDLRRQQREARKREMTKEERKAYRESKRMTVEMNQNKSRVKIDKQIGGFMMMMQKLEADWQKTEETRIKANAEMEEQRKLMEKLAGQLEFLISSLSDLSARMDHLKLMLDRLVDTAPKSVKKEEKYLAQLSVFQEKFWKMRHQAYISTAKYKKMMEEQQQAATKEANGPPTAPTGPIATPKRNPISNLLGQIQKGTALKKLDPKQVEAEKKQRKGNWRQSVALLQGLQDTLKDALDQRHLSLFSDDEDDDWDEEESDEEE